MLKAPENRIGFSEEINQETQERAREKLQNLLDQLVWEEYQEYRDQDGMDFQALMDRMVWDELQVQRNQETNLTVQSAMRTGHLTSFFTPEQIVTPARVMRNGHLKSVWFKHAEHLGLREPAVLNFFFGRPPNEDAEPFIENQEKEVWDLLNRLNLQPYLWTNSGKLTIFAARPSDLQYLPTDITGTEQESESGLVFQPGADPGKQGKRLRVFSGAPGILFHSEPSLFPELNLGEDRKYRVGLRDSGTVGDGGGCCKASVAKKILKESGAPLWGDIVAFQIVILGSDYSFKGLINIIPDQLWQHGVDLLIDQESVNHQVHSTKVTIGKVMPTRHKPNRRYFYVEPLNHGEIVGEITDVDEVTEQVMAIAERIDRENWKQVMETWHASGHVPGRDEPWWLRPQAEEWEKSSHIQQAAQRDEEEINGLMYAYEVSGRSPFFLTAVTNMLTEGIPNSWEAKLNRSRKKAHGWDKKDKPTLSGIMISGECVVLMDPYYAGVPYPEEGYLRLIWHADDENEIKAAGLSPEDTRKYREALDGYDVDGDKGYIMPMLDEKGRPVAELLRLPASPYGGICLKMYPEDAAKMRRLGYHFNRRAGEKRFPNLYERVDGEQVYPDVLHATPHENPPVWTTDPGLMVRRAAELNQYHGYVGKVFLALANLVFADQYDPCDYKFSVSEEVVDPSLNCSRSPEGVYTPLHLANVRLVEREIPVDHCIFPKIQSGVKQLFKERNPGAEYEPIITCKPRHRRWGETQEGANGFQRNSSRAKALLTHGPADWLLQKFRTKLYNIATRALEDRMVVWKDKSVAEKEVRRREDLNRVQQEAVIAGLIQDAKESERAIVIGAYLKAVKTVEDLKPGQFIAAWVQAAAARQQRTRRFEPIGTNVIIRLPSVELDGYADRGASLPTAIIRVDHPDSVVFGERYFVEEESKKEGGKEVKKYWLVSEAGLDITELRAEARNYLGLELEAIGDMPKITVTRRKVGNTWEQAQNQMVFRALNPRDA